MDLYYPREDRLDVVSVPFSLQSELEKSTTTKPILATFLATKRCGARYVDCGDLNVQDVLCSLAELISRARNDALPDEAKYRQAAATAVGSVHEDELINTLLAFGRQKLFVRTELRTLKHDLRTELVGTVTRLLLRAATKPPPRRRRAA